MRKPLIAGNWKMYKDHQQAVELVGSLWGMIDGIEGVEVAVCPPFTSIPAVSSLIKERGMGLGLGAQDAYFEKEGAFTGEVSLTMLKPFGVDRIIVGHSERRQILGEGDDLVAKKLAAVLEEGMQAILCCGETLQEREAGGARKKVEDQLRAALDGVSPERSSGLVVAYEPIWAIGTGVNATPEDAQDMISFIREWLSGLWGKETAEGIRILYGGSVKPDNASDILSMPDIDGALVGGASLKAEDFASIIRAGEESA